LIIKELTSETFDPTTFTDDYTLVIYTIGQDFDEQNPLLPLCKSKNIPIYIIDTSKESNSCLLDYYQYDMSSGYYYIFYNNEGKIIHTLNDGKKVIQFLS
jgi:hypothetical protein